MKYATYKSLKAERTANVLTITMNRPEELNAINEPLYYELSTIFVDASMDKEVDVVVFTGAGRAFSRPAVTGTGCASRSPIQTPFSVHSSQLSE